LTPGVAVPLPATIYLAPRITIPLPNTINVSPGIAIPLIYRHLLSLSFVVFF